MFKCKLSPQDNIPGVTVARSQGTGLLLSVPPKKLFPPPSFPASSDGRQGKYHFPLLGGRTSPGGRTDPPPAGTPGSHARREPRACANALAAASQSATHREEPGAHPGQVLSLQRLARDFATCPGGPVSPRLLSAWFPESSKLEIVSLGRTSC